MFLSHEQVHALGVDLLAGFEAQQGRDPTIAIRRPGISQLSD